MRFKHMGWLRLSLAEADTEKTPVLPEFLKFGRQFDYVVF